MKKAKAITDISYDKSFKYYAEKLRELPESFLKGLLQSAGLALSQLEHQGAIGKVKKLGIMPCPHLFSKIKKDIARIKTILNERN